MPEILDVVRAVYEVSTVITDVLLNNEYIERGWKEEYTLSILFLVFNGFVMAVVGHQLEAKGPHRRYTRVPWLNAAVGGLIGLLQLRVLTETLYMYIVSVQGNKPQENNGGSGHQHQQQQQQPVETPKEREKRMAEGLLHVAFVQAMVRDVPLFVIQANATIHYRKWELVDLWAVVSTGLTLLSAVSGYAKSKSESDIDKTGNQPHSKLFSYTATLFLLGQFVFRLGAILLVATTTGFTIIAYSAAIVAITIVLAVTMRIATPVQAIGAQVTLAVLFFPLFSVFTLDAAHMGPVVGDLKLALYSPKLLILNLWRVVENVVGIVLAVSLPRYTDFGNSTDQEIALIGAACGGFYFVTLVAFVIAARGTENSDSEITEEDATLYHRNDQNLQPV